MQIRVNEQPYEFSGTARTVGALAAELEPGADVLILNGFPTKADTVLQEGDELFLIRRGKIPSEEELEALMAARHTPGVHNTLKRAVVGIAGVGGLGSAIAVALARVGVGRLILADFDVVEPSNLNRQHFFIDQIGELKVKALAANLARINPYIAVEIHPVMLTTDTIPAVFAPCSIVVEAFDRAEQKAMLVDTVLDMLPDVTTVAASGLAGFGPNNEIVTRKVSRRLYVIGDGTSEAGPGNGLMAPRVGIAAHHQANQVVRLILGENE